MKTGSGDLNGNAPDSHPVALLLVDVINPLDFPEGADLLRYALPAAEQMQRLAQQARQKKVPVIYANDNFGRWRSDLAAVVDRCLEPDCKGRPLCERLRPDDADYFVLKPKHSAFYCTTLDLLLRSLGTRTLIVCGFAGNICVLFTANDAYMRDLQLVVPPDGIASNTSADNEEALRQIQKVLKAELTPCQQIDFDSYT